MNYFGFIFRIDPAESFCRDLLINALGEAGFDTFEETPDGFNAWIQADRFDEDRLNEALEGYSGMCSFSYTRETVEQKNWNEVWESNFEPLAIGDTCYVRASFHLPRPEYPYEIVIDPKMAFGTGHHQTTTMMMEFMLETDMNGRSVLDMGCGTGILAILASKLGAADITAIDYDPVCYDSTVENARLNRVSGLHVLCGSKEVIPDKKFDRIFANINRNILLDQLGSYSAVLKPGGWLFISGFYDSDVAILLDAARNYSFINLQSRNINNWSSLKLLRQ